MPHLKSVVGFAVAASFALAVPVSALAGPMTISSTTNQSGFFAYTSGSDPLTGNPYDFSGRNYGSLAAIGNLQVTLTLNDADTGPGDFDFDNLTLALDGIDTGLKLNGFTDDALEPNQPITLSFSGTPSNAAAILAALQADGRLAGSINDATPGDNVFHAPGKSSTTLDISGQQVPEPATLVLFGMGLLGVAAWSMRQRRLPA